MHLNYFPLITNNVIVCHFLAYISWFCSLLALFDIKVKDNS